MDNGFDSSRAVLEVTGDDRLSFLQGIVTQDIQLLTPTRGLFAAILTPQGKLAHDFFLLTHQDAILIDTPAAGKDMLLKRLAMYKLRAKVSVRDVSGNWRVGYLEEAPGKAGDATREDHAILLIDPRDGHLGTRVYTSSAGARGKLLPLDVYHRQRIALGIPDSASGDTTEDDVAMDLGYDLLNAINFTKGCYVGQEVTARMHYKQIARKGFYIVEGQQALPAPGTPVKAGEVTVGTLRGSLGRQGLAFLKFAEVAAAEDKKLALSVDNLPITAHLPKWLAPKLARFHAAQENQ